MKKIFIILFWIIRIPFTLCIFLLGLMILGLFKIVNDGDNISYKDICHAWSIPYSTEKSYIREQKLNEILK